MREKRSARGVMGRRKRWELPFSFSPFQSSPARYNIPNLSAQYKRSLCGGERLLTWKTSPVFAVLVDAHGSVWNAPTNHHWWHHFTISHLMSSFKAISFSLFQLRLKNWSFDFFLKHFRPWGVWQLVFIPLPGHQHGARVTNLCYRQKDGFRSNFSCCPRSDSLRLWSF